MAKLKRPALDPADVESRTGSSYPEPFRSRVVPREKRALAKASGLTKVADTIEYPGVDLAARKDDTGRPAFFRKDGSAY